MKLLLQETSSEWHMFLRWPNLEWTLHNWYIHWHKSLLIFYLFSIQLLLYRQPHLSPCLSSSPPSSGLIVTMTEVVLVLGRFSLQRLRLKAIFKRTSQNNIISMMYINVRYVFLIIIIIHSLCWSYPQVMALLVILHHYNQEAILSNANKLQAGFKRWGLEWVWVIDSLRKR